MFPYDLDMPRHAVDPTEMQPATRRAFRLGSIVSPILSMAWPWLGRAILGASVFAIVACRVTGTTEADLTSDGGGPFLAQFAMIMSLVLGILSPYILLPHGFVSLARSDGSVIRCRTVLGPRSIDLDSARAFFWSIPSNTGTVDFVTLVGRPSGALILSRSGSSDLGSWLGKLARGRFERPVKRVTIGMRVRRFLLELVVPSILALVFVFAVIVAMAVAALGG